VTFYDVHDVGKKPESMDVTDWLRHQILAGTYSPGERLREERLARDLNVSRTPVRQALMKLEAEGTVEMEPKRGARVRSFSAEDVWNVYDLRAVLESHAAQRAAQRVRESELSGMRESIEEFARHGGEADHDPEGQVRWLVKCNQQFHDAIVVASGNPRLEMLLQRTVELPLIFKAVFWYTPYERSIANHHHRLILNALEEGDGERAEILMREHVYEGRDRVIRSLEEDARRDT
jgi:DNA-binding GntR family transcriptional regulator